MKRPCHGQKRKQKNTSMLNDIIEEHIVNTIPNHGENEIFEEIQKYYIKILD